MKIPVLLQANGTECGIACIAMVATGLGRPTAIGEIRRRIGYSTLGNTVKALIDLSSELGLHARALRLEPDDARRLKTPCILLWGTHHFVVLKRVTRRHWIILDPAVGERRYARNDVARFFSGIALELTPGKSLTVEEAPPRLELRTLWRQATGVVPVLAWLVILSVVLQLVALISPLYIQLVVDDGLARNDRELLPLLAVGFGALVAMSAITSHLRSAISLRAGISLDDQLAANLCTHLLHLPLHFFVQRDIGDVNARFASLKPVLQVFTSGIVAVIIDGALAFTTFVLLWTYQAALALVVSAFLLATMTIRLATVPKLRTLTADAIRAVAAEQTVFIESLRSILSLKANAMERARAALWRHHHLDSVDASARTARFGLRIDLTHALLTGTENILVVYLGAMSVIDGGLTIGMLYAFIAYKSHFVRATTGLVQQLVELRLLRLHLDQLSDIIQTPAESTADNLLIEAGIRGTITATDLHFRYAPQLPEVLQGISFTAAEGEEIAIVGGSGSGKSTLLRILIGLVEPTTGTVVFDGTRPLATCRGAVKSGTGVVLQGDALFTGNIRDNVSLFSLDVDADRVAECCRIAAIDDDIRALPMGYDTPLGDMGMTLSAGQMQRLLIARALYKSPRILLLDEATANLDDTTRARLNTNLRALGITMIRVTHRPDEIAACAAVYLLERGALSRVTKVDTGS